MTITIAELDGVFKQRYGDLQNCVPSWAILQEQIKFATGMSIEAIVVEDNKLDAKLAKLSEALDTTFDSLGADDMDLENLDISSEDDESRGDTRCDDEVLSAHLSFFGPAMAGSFKAPMRSLTSARFFVTMASTASHCASA
jgi:hypothetical protein